MAEIFRSGEDYLEAIYILTKEDNAPIKSVDLAQYMGVSKPSVSRGLTPLVEQGYITKQAYGSIMITPLGVARAKIVAKKHDALKKLLVETLGVSEQTAEKDACKIEHILSDETTEKLFKFVKM